MFRFLLASSVFLACISCGKHESLRLPGVEANGGGSFARDSSSAGIMQSAIQAGDIALVKSHVEKGFPLESILPSKRTALTEAVAWNRRKIAEFLVERGADADAKDASGANALSLAKGNLNLEQVLLPHLKQEIEKALFAAIAAKDSKALKKSLETDFADPNAVNAEGETVLTLSIKLEATALFRALFQKRGGNYLEMDLSLKNQAGESPLRLARAKNISAVISFLEKNGAIE